MCRIRTRLIGWTYDETRQEIHTPAGHVIPLRDIAQRMQDDARCRYDFGGEWNGWKMRGNRLIPGSSRDTCKNGTLVLKRNALSEAWLEI